MLKYIILYVGNLGIFDVFLDVYGRQNQREVKGGYMLKGYRLFIFKSGDERELVRLFQ